MDMTSQYQTEQPAPPGALLDPVALLVRDRYRRARRWRAVERIGRFTVEETLRNCYRQYHAILDPHDQELVDASGIDLTVSITKHKTDVLVAWMRDLLLNSADAPFVVSPTPIPELSVSGKAQVVQQVKKKLLADGATPGPEGLVDLVRQLKAQQLAAEQDIAQAASKAMQQRIEEQLVEASFRDELLMFLTNFALYPYAVLVGPTPEMRPVFHWKGNRPVETYEPMLAVRNVSPFDYFWSPDSPSGGKGTFDVIRERMTKYRLMMSATLPGYITKNVIEALQHFALPETNRDWLNPNPDKPMVGSLMWGLDDSIDVIRHYGLLSGRELRRYGMSVDDGEYHETEAVVLGYWTIRLLVNPNPNTAERPVYVTSYQRTPGKLPGHGIGQLVRDIERAFMAALRGTLENVSYSVAPLGEVDYRRIQRYVADDQIGNVMAGTVVPTDPDPANGGRPAHYFHTVPTVTQQTMSLMQFFIDMADRWTGLPAALSGQPIGTGVNRTFRGIMALYGNALKGVQSALTNLDIDVFERMGNAYFSFNMKYDPDPSIRGDAKVKARGTSGLLEKEVAKQNAQDTLQFIAQLAQTGDIPPALLKWAIDQALVAAGVPLDQFPDESTPSQQAGAPQQPGAPGAPPSPSPVGGASVPDSNVAASSAPGQPV
ncbi:hypothetical protein P3T23_004537 [Paraburkholderia sp. GAS448]|uniref:hypothetical protein n=1 Tax=Paraburkholderia sp. GAS448 TaxID=3035136 RepID=UPI003D2512F0